ncbi:MAG TPA: beta-L-arabinofuranosidase domain-containing protein, partial [Opitutales bacterium]|nr:beta-L-arabinofuranosidase domain-containing protein [Opitutales bacterium]
MRPTSPTPTRDFCPCCGRREFLITSFSAAAALLLANLTGCAVSPDRSTSASRNSLKNAIPFACTPLPLTAVRLTGGPLQKAQALGAQDLLKIDMDRVMFHFRERAGLTPRASDGYGGWEGPGRQLTGHIAGHYLSAVSYMYSATGDAQFKDRANYLVNEYKEVQDAQGDGYIGALMGNPPRGTGGGPVDGKILFQQIAQGNINAGGRAITNPATGGFDLNGMWSPWYVQHKLMAGLRDAYRQTGNRTAIDVAAKHAAWIESIVGNLSPQQLQLMMTIEFGGINESLADLYADTGDSRWLTLSQRFHHDYIVNPLAQGRDILNGKHGNTNVPKLLGELARYIYAGNAPDGDAAKFFWEAVVNHHTFATGGHGYDEAFGPADKLSGQVDGTIKANGDTRTCESCNVYNMVKITRLLFALNPDNKFAEFHERALFNHVLASINFNDGTVCYMVPVGKGMTHEYQRNNPMTCCQGTGMENHALHALGLYYTAADKLWVNIYTPSTAQWSEQGVAFETSVVTDDVDMATLKFTASTAKAFTLAMRRPLWAGDGFAINVNGTSIQELPQAGAYGEIKRVWKAGDTVTVTLPKALYKEPLPDNANRVALKWGPYVLAADYGSANARPNAAATLAVANSVGGGAGGAAAGGAAPAAANGSATGGRRGGGRGAGGPPPKYPVFVAKADDPVSNWLKRAPSA